MKLLILCAPLLLSGNLLHAMTLPLKSEHLPRQMVGEVILRTADDHLWLMAAGKARLCDFIVEEWNRHQNSGTEAHPINVPLTREQLKLIDVEFLENLISNRVREIRVNYLGYYKLNPLADVIKCAWLLKCTSLCDLAKAEFIKKLKIRENLNEFVNSAKFLDSFMFSQELKDSLGHMLLDEAEFNYFRTLLYKPLVARGVPTQVSFSPTNDCLSAHGRMGENHGFCNIWDAETGEEIGCDGVKGTAEVRYDQFLLCPFHATLSEESVGVWNLAAKTGKPGKHYIDAEVCGRPGMKFSALAASPDYTVLAFGLGDGIVLRDLKRKEINDRSLRLLRTTEEGRDIGRAEYLLFTTDGKLIEVRSIGMVRVWRVENGVCEGVAEEAIKTPIIKCHYNDTSKELATVTKDGKLIVWDCKNGCKVSQKWERSEAGSWQQAYTGLCFDSTGRKVALAAEDGSGVLFDLVKNEFSARKLEPRNHREIQDCRLVAGCFHPDDIILATATDGNAICLWDTRDNLFLACLSADAHCTGLSFSSDGLLASAYANQKVRLWHYFNEKTAKYLRYNIDLPKGLLLLLIIDAKKNNRPLDFLRSANLKTIFEQLDPNLIRRYIAPLAAVPAQGAPAPVAAAEVKPAAVAPASPAPKP